MAEEKVIKNRRFLVDNVDPDPILDILIQKGLTNVETIRTECRNGKKNEANRMILDSLSRMRDGKGHEHYIEALQEEDLVFVLETLGCRTPAAGVPPATYNNTQSARNPFEQAHVGNLETPQSFISSCKTTASPVQIKGVDMTTSDGAANSRVKVDDDLYDDTATSPDGACKGEQLEAPPHHYEVYRREPTEHEYASVEESGMTVRLAQPTTLQGSQNVSSSCPDELSALTKDSAWHAHINDSTIHKHVGKLCACPAGTYIMWYSKKKGAMLISVAVPEISKKHVHFKMLRTEKEGVPHYHFDSRLQSKDLLAVLEYVKDNGLLIKPAKLRHYQAQS